MTDMAEMPNMTDEIEYGIGESRYGRVMCYRVNETRVKIDANAWENGITLTYAIPFFVTQILVANASYRLLYYLTRPLRLPPFVAQILSGLAFSPTVLGSKKFVLDHVFPYRFTMAMEIFANLALVLNVFLLGLGMDFRMIKIKDIKSIVIAIVSLIVSVAAGAGLYFVKGNGDTDKIKSGCFFWAVALGCTNFPDLARVLADLKLLRTDIGRTAMSASIITDLFTWILLVIGFAVFFRSGDHNDKEIVARILISVSVYVLLCYFVIRPIIAWVFTHTVKGGQVGDTHVWFILAGVIVSSLITELLGAKSITGAFVFGLSIPQDHIIRKMIEEKLHDFLSGILMPLFYVTCGYKTNLVYMFGSIKHGIAALVISAAFWIKIVPTVFCSVYLFRMPLRDSFALGALMNTKGTMALVVLNAGRDIKALDVSMYTEMTLVFLAMSIVVQPLLSLTYNPKKKSTFYKNRTIQKVKGETEFRVLTCVHALPNVSGITSLLQLSNPTTRSPINVFAIHLVELTGKTNASMLIMNDESKPKANFSDRVRAESEQIAETFEGMEVNNEGMTVQTITAVSPYTTMHEDISMLAEDKQASLILLPYHKGLTSDGRLGEGNAAHAELNQHVLSHAPCSVGILVDRGMTIMRSESSSFKGEATKREIAMIFIGGRDDREALAYAWRMAGQTMVTLAVVRFVPSRENLLSAGKAAVQYEKEKQVDEECIYEFNFKTMNDSSVTYTEKVVNDGQETIAAIRELEDNHPYDLYIVGRGYKVESPATLGLTDWSSAPDLGTIGDTLASSNFTMQASVLVIQQYSVANRQTANHYQEALDGRAKTANEVKPFMDDDDEEDENYQVGMRK